MARVVFWGYARLARLYLVFALSVIRLHRRFSPALAGTANKKRGDASSERRLAKSSLLERCLHSFACVKAARRGAPKMRRRYF